MAAANPTDSDGPSVSTPKPPNPFDDICLEIDDSDTRPRSRTLSACSAHFHQQQCSWSPVPTTATPSTGDVAERGPDVQTPPPPPVCHEEEDLPPPPYSGPSVFFPTIDGCGGPDVYTRMNSWWSSVISEQGLPLDTTDFTQSTLILMLLFAITKRMECTVYNFNKKITHLKYSVTTLAIVFLIFAVTVLVWLFIEHNHK
ncbi:protein E31A [Elephant endotheliotropic herpesvirus 3B]|nr:protein E31A [Elephant endotheliotropic herpesvirus 3B]